MALSLTSASCVHKSNADEPIQGYTFLTPLVQRIMSESEFEGESIQSLKGRFLRAKELWSICFYYFTTDDINSENYEWHRRLYKRSPVAQEIVAQTFAEIDYILARDPKNLTCWYVRVKMKIWIGDFEGTIADGNRYLELDPDTFDAKWVKYMIEDAEQELAKRAIRRRQLD